ncbi:hypothetical protein [Nonomuraea sp. NPDC003804]|uniref:hypothetical protein n=1 Tax=Nonomuraea sp. NPDC003804 TaxID=3154547 RepID=UPI0033A1BC54
MEAPAIRIREGVDELLKQRFECSTSRGVAERIGVHEATWSRAVRGVSAPGKKLAALLLQIDGLRFDDIFEVHTGEESA